MYFEVAYYHTDLFRAIRDERNAGSRGHPVLSALLYAFCPISARWWLNGADPVIPYDPVWEAAGDFAAGITLKEALEKREIPDLIGHARKYIDAVTTYRHRHSFRSPELFPLFKGEEIEVTARAGYQAAFDKHFGGDWRNVLRFVRAWAFTFPDWRGDCEIQPGKNDYKFESLSLALSAPRIKQRTLEWPAWCWRVKKGHALRIVLGLMVNDGLQDQLRFALVAMSNGYFKESKTGRRVVPWEVTPQLYCIERQVGMAEPFNARFDVEQLMACIPQVAAIAEKGACLPLAALSHYKKCEHCGFQAMCFTREGEATPLVYESIKQDAGKFDRIFS